MIRKKNKYQKPRKAFELTRIKEENALVIKYGLKNKKEIWKTLAKVNYYRGRAKALAKLPLEKQEVLFNKLKAIGLKTDTTADVLDLKVENLLDRRLPTIVVKKKLTTTLKHARQLVTHKKILVEGKVVNSPSYLVPVSQENSITLKQKIKQPKAETPVEQSAETPEQKTETQDNPIGNQENKTEAPNPPVESFIITKSPSDNKEETK